MFSGLEVFPTGIQSYLSARIVIAPREPSPVRKNLGIERFGFERAAQFVTFGPNSKTALSGLAVGDEDFAARTRHQAGHLRSGSFCNARVDTIAFQFDDGSLSLGAQQQFSQAVRPTQNTRFPPDVQTVSGEPSAAIFTTCAPPVSLAGNGKGPARMREFRMKRL